MITVDVTDVTAVHIGGEWVRVTDVTVDFAEYVTAPGTRHGRGPHLAATIQGGPQNGQRLVAPLSRVEAVRVNP